MIYFKLFSFMFLIFNLFSFSYILNLLLLFIIIMYFKKGTLQKSYIIFTINRETLDNKIIPYSSQHYIEYKSPIFIHPVL